MDDRQLQELMTGSDVPPPDENARKAAVNLALAAFDEASAEKTRASSQGSGWLGRLISRSNPSAEARQMRRKYMFGGAATALALVLAVTSYDIYLAPDQMTETDALQNAPEPAKKATTELAGEAGATLKREETERAAAPAEAPAGRGRTDSATRLFADEKADTSRMNQNGAVPATRPTGQTQTTPRPPVPEPTVGARDKAAADAVRANDRIAPMAKTLAAPVQSELRRNAARQNAQETQFRRAPRPADLQPNIYSETGRDRFSSAPDNPVKRVADAPVSTFSIDVDTASYSFVRRELQRGVMPAKDSVRIEELINYFPYDYPLPESRERPFEPSVAVFDSPWTVGNKLIRIGIKGYDIAPGETPRSNLVFLLDVSGSMNRPDKLGLMVASMKLLLAKLRPDDTVAIVTYAGRSGTVLEPTKVSDKAAILQALDGLRAGGSTAGAAGITQAYALAERNFDKKAVNRVILATDGDFNVGVSNTDQLKEMIEKKRDSGVFLSVLGFGQGNLNDALMQALAQNGNGVAAHIDSLAEAQKVLVDEATSTLFPIAKDVKIQVEFNPATVGEYRLIGYETRALRRQDFDNDKIDAGDIGAGHAVTAIYEITPAGRPGATGQNRYQQQTAAPEPRGDFSNEYGFLKIRYKLPDQDTSTLITRPIVKADEHAPDAEARWATAVAAFGQLLKGGQYTGSFSYDDVLALAQGARGDDPYGYRSEFLTLVRLAKSASGSR